MTCYAFEGLRPVVDPASFVHPAAQLIGDVIIGPGCYVAANATLRGDFGRVVVEGDSSVQEGCVLHTSSVSDCIVGRGSTVGHGAIVHGARLGENVLVGMRSLVLDEAEIGDESLIRAGAIVMSDMRAPPRSYLAGDPAMIRRTLGAGEIGWRADGQGEYQRLARRCLDSFESCEPLDAPEPGRARPTPGAIPVRLRDRHSQGGH
ncbi:gamma carbonic anhydrase family protein [Rhizorhabdus histidinilytica]|uniref:gamma carbonic anhydrase family protein n=1 Tax=Rhizorhabdus histidinilytica TaxID=439228 RepID=UPI00321FC24F